MAGLVPAIHVLQNFNMAGGYVYILTNRPNGILYVGVTSDLVRRIFEHRSGFVDGFTKRYGLKRLVYFEQFDDIRDAMDVDGNRNTDALTDGVLIIRYMFGLKGDALTGKNPMTLFPGDAIGPGATRSTAPAIETYIGSLMP